METDHHHHKPIAVLLGETQVLHRLSHEARERLAHSGSFMGLEAGATLSQAGDKGDAVYLVLEGEVEILARSPEGVDVRIAAMGHGAIVGEMAALEGGLRSVDMVAAHRCRLYRIPRGALIDVLRSDPDAAIDLIIELSRRLRASNATLEATVRLDLAGRLARLLLEAMNSHGRVTLTQTEIARRLVVSREQVNRKLNAWSAEGLVENSTAGVQILDPDTLTALTRGSRHH